MTCLLVKVSSGLWTECVSHSSVACSGAFGAGGHYSLLGVGSRNGTTVLAKGCTVVGLLDAAQCPLRGHQSVRMGQSYLWRSMARRGFDRGRDG